MIDLRTTIQPKSDQLNADDLIGTTKTIKVTKVSILAAADQPIAINYEGDNGKPYKPCKSMRRVMVNIWGNDGNAYVGRSMTLYRDEKVRFGGVDVGGIRISHMSHINAPVTMALTAAKSSRKPYTVQPLAAQVPVKVAEPAKVAELNQLLTQWTPPEGWTQRTLSTANAKSWDEMGAEQIEKVITFVKTKLTTIQGE